MSTRLFLSRLWITTVIHSMDVTDVPFSLFPLLQKGNVIHIKYSCKALRKAMRNAVVNVNEENEAKKSVLWLLLEHFKESIHLIKQRNEYGNVKLLHNLYEHYKEKWLQKTILLMITKGLNLGYTYNGTSVLHKASMDGFEWLVDQITK